MTSDDSPLTRRAYLRAAGATALAGALAGCGERNPDATETETRTARTTRTGTPTDETTTSTDGTATPTDETAEPAATETPADSLRDRFETVVNVADAGADASAEEPINPVLDDHVGDDTLLYFPPGRYRLREWKLTGHRNLGVVGDDAALVPPESKQSYWLMFDRLRDFLFQGLELDCRATGVAPVNYLAVTGGESVVRDVSLRGHRTLPRSGFEVSVADPDAQLLLENVRLPDGSTDGNAIYTFPASVGKLTVKDCRVEHWAEGLYASPHSGPLRVLGGYYANNGVDQVRVGGGPNGALVRGVTVRVDDPRRAKHKPNMRGIWMEEGGHVRIEDCDIAITDLSGTYSSGAIVVGKQFGSAVVENTRIRTDRPVYALNLRNHIESVTGQSMPSMGRLPNDWRVTCRNVRISGRAAEGTAIRTNRRDDCRFENLCIDHSNGNRDGVSVTHADGCAVRNSLIDVGGRAVTTENATVQTSGLRTSGNC